MYIEDHSFHLPSPSLPLDTYKSKPLALTSPHPSAFSRRTSISSTSSTTSTDSGSEFRSFSPSPSPRLYEDEEDDEEVQKTSHQIDLYSRAILVLSLIYSSGSFSTENEGILPVVNDLIHPDCTFEVEHIDAQTSRCGSRDEYLKAWRQKVRSFGVNRIDSTVRECAVDEGQMKVWVVSELGFGVGGIKEIKKESVDMLTFDEMGRMVRRDGWFRKPRKGRTGDD